MAIVGISGPQHSGKSTLISLIEKSLPMDAVVIHDIHDSVYEGMVAEGFANFKEISKDRDYLLVYYGRLINHYTEMLDAYKDYPGLVLFDGSHIDLLIYGMLTLWYHYPTKGVQESLVHNLLDHRNLMRHIYMTNADDYKYRIDKLGLRRYSTSFLQNRKTELDYYEIFRELPYVTSLPSASVIDCDQFIIEDMKSKSLL